VTLTPTTWLIAAAALVACVLVGLLVAWRRRRRRSLDYLLGRIAWERLEDVIIPDDVDGEIHLDLALLTPRGILVLEVRRLTGTLFWGDQLESWTVLDGARRTVLRNPLPGMQARRHAVHALAPRVPVDGRVLMFGPVELSGGAPPGVLLAEDLVTAFPARGREGPRAELRAAWEALKAASRPA
jgi:hypothetical protein